MDKEITKVEINESTTVPLFNVLMASVVLIGGIFWLSAVAAAAFASERRLDKVEDVIVQMRNDVTYLRVREELKEKQEKQSK